MERSYIIIPFRNSGWSRACVVYFLGDRKIGYTVRSLVKSAVTHGKEWEATGKLPRYGTTITDREYM